MSFLRRLFGRPDVDRLKAKVDLVSTDILDILPPPFEWCEIPAGQVTLQFSDPQNPFHMLSKTFDVPPFHMGKYPITYAQFQVFIDAPDGFYHDQWWQGLDVSDEHRKQPGGQEYKFDNHPRENVSWYDAVAFCRWLSDKLGYEVRLPTEWEWQWAAQGSDGRVFPWGDEFSVHKCNMLDSGIGETTTPVDKYPMGASPFGVMDMAGNVWEWCLNTYKHPVSTSLSGNSDRVCRGGNFKSIEGWVTTVYRGGYQWGHPDSRSSTGFRVARFK